MRVPPSALRSPIALAILLVAGCAEPTAPIAPALRTLTGTYVLQSVDGAPVPVLQLTYTFTRQLLLADTLSADGQGHYAEVILTAIDSVGTAYRTIQRATRSGEYQIRNDTEVVFPYTCPPFASCVNPPDGWLLSDGELVVAPLYTTGYMFVRRYKHVE